MRPLSRLVPRAGAVVLLLLVPAPATAAAAPPKQITGKLNKGGYTVIALASNGKAKAVRATRGGKFRIRPPARRVTLHLRARNGRYAGPIVVGRKKRGRIAILGVRAGTKLGRVRVNARRGYARVARKLRRKRWADPTRRARARRAVPIGAGKFGRVRSRPSLGRRGQPKIPGDQDVDGIPGPLDIDDDGDLILDTVDRSTAARAAQTPGPTFSVFPLLSLSLEQTANANHPALAARIDTALPASGRLNLGSGFGRPPCPPGAFCAASTELDCAGDPAAVPPRPGLVYCSRGGTARGAPPGTPRPTGACRPDSAPFPGDPGGPFDPDGDGFGTVPPFDGCAQLAHGATSAQIKTGDLLIERASNAAGVEIGALSQTLPYVFATVPALVSYDDDGPGGSAATTLSYPYPPGAANELPVSPRPTGDPDAGDVVVTLTLWRPQRSRIAKDPQAKAGESAAWTDIGGLGYVAGLGAGECPRAVFSENDPNLTDRAQLPLGAASVFTDTRPDQPANPNETLTFTMNITRCLELQGQQSSFDESGEVRGLFLIAAGGGRADQTVTFKRVG